jgi:ABC-type uncharacterized transport system permease subunit
MLAGISLTCFTASYAVVLALEATRLWFRSGLRGALLLGFLTAGVFAHTLFLVHRALTADGTPLSSEFDWYLIAAWTLALINLVWTVSQVRAAKERPAAIGLFVLPLVLGLIAAAYFIGSRQPLERDPAQRVWIVIHLGLLVCGFVSVLAGFAAGVMDLVQSSRLKRKMSPQRGLRLPSLEWLEQIGIRSIFSSFALSFLGLLAGFLLNLILGEFPWNDPVVWSLVVIVVWFATASLFLLLYKPARQGRKVAYLTIASLAVVVTAVAAGRMLPSAHATPTKNALHAPHVFSFEKENV